MTIVQKVMMYIAALVLAVGYPISAMATTQEVTETPPTTQTQTPPTTESPAPSTTMPPAGSTPTTPTQPTAPAPKPEEPKLTYVYNPLTGRWDSEKWQYNPATNTYEKPVVITVDPVKEDAKGEPDSTSETTKDIDTKVNVENTITSDAKTGDATVKSNTLAGSAASGDAAATATLVNIVNSEVTTGNNAQIAEFTQDIYGDVKGDILLHPMLLKAFLEAEAHENASNINVNNSTQITNNLDLNAVSGNATVNGNTKAGNATTGTATAMANVVNILNSMIAAQQSFVGTINIYGNLEGDILIAPDFIPQLVASNGGLKNSDGSDVIVSSTDTQAIVNNIAAAAESGASAVFGNTKGGNAKTGNADSNVVIFNLTGHEVVAKNSLLVFINVMGTWVGAIVDAPQGATSALLTNGMSKNNHTPNLIVNADTNAGITNNITVTATSGDATVSENTEAGNATTGNAKAGVNVANIVGSQFASTDWFGVLNINIFKSWKGCFGYKCTFTKPPTTMDATPPPTGPVQFVPQTADTGIKSNYQLFSTNPGNTQMYVVLDAESISDNQVVKQASAKSVDPAIAGVADAARKTSELVGESFDFRVLIVAGSILVIGASVIGLRRILG